MLTFCYLAAFNWWLVLCPSTLSHDWQMGSIPLLTSISDPRNLLTLWAFASTILMLHRSLLDFEVCIYSYLIKCLSIKKMRTVLVYRHITSHLLLRFIVSFSSFLFIQSHSFLCSCIFFFSRCFPTFGIISQSQRYAPLILGVLLLILPFLPATNLFVTVGFVVAERVLYIPRYKFRQ